MLDAPPVRSDGDRVAPNSIWMVLSVAVGVFQGVAVTLVMSHHLGLVAFGQLGLILSCTNVILFASSSVIANVLRESARARFESSMVVAAMLTQIMLAAPVLLGALGVLSFVSGDAALLGPAALLGVALMLRTALGPLVGYKLGRERMEWQLLDSAHALLTLVVLLGCVAFGMRIYALPVASLAGTGVVVLIAAAIWGRRMPAGSLRPSRSVFRLLVVPTLLWSGVSLAQQVHWSVEPLLAPALMDHAQVGLFIAAGRLLPVTRSLAAALGLVFLPMFVRAYHAGDGRELSERAAHALRYLVPCGVASMAALFVAADWIVALLYPTEFRDAAAIIRYLSLTVAATFLHWHALCLLFAADKLRLLITTYALVVVVRAAVGAWLGSAGGAIGLATAEVVSDWTLALALQVIALRTLSLSYGRDLLKGMAGDGKPAPG